MEDQERPVDLESLLAQFIEEVEAGKQPKIDEYARLPSGAGDLFRTQAEAYLRACGILKAVGPSSDPRPLQVPDAPPGYEILREIGRGGMSVVYLATQHSLNRKVALKIIRLGPVDDMIRARFKTEASATASLRHPGIVTVHDFGATDSVLYIAMEYVDGQSLAQVLDHVREQTRTGAAKDQALGSLQGIKVADKNYVHFICRVLRGVADAMECAHQGGIVHRDIKPSNILLRSDGSAVLADFGLARIQAEPGVTKTGEAFGTPHYMAPEQITGLADQATSRTDIYSLGVTTFECLTLQVPFPGSNTANVLNAIAHQAPPRLRRMDKAIPRDLETITEVAMARVPADRYASAAAMRDDLQAFTEFRAISARPPTITVRIVRGVKRHAVPIVASVVVLFAGAAALKYWTESEDRAEQIRLADEESARVRQMQERERTFDRWLCEALFYSASDQTQFLAAVREARAIRDDPILRFIECVRMLSLAEKMLAGARDAKTKEAFDQMPDRMKISLQAIYRGIQRKDMNLDKLATDTCRQQKLTPRECMVLAGVIQEAEGNGLAHRAVRDKGMVEAPNDVVVQFLGAVLVEGTDVFGGENAKRVIESAITLRPDIKVLYLAGAQIASKEGWDSARAALLLKDGLRHHPNDFDLLWLCGQQMLESNQAHDAVDFLRRACALQPENSFLAYQLGRAAFDTFQPQVLEEVLSKHKPDENFRARFELLRAAHLALSWNATPQTREQALLALRKADLRSPPILSDELVWAAQICWCLGDRELAKAILEKSAKTDANVGQQLSLSKIAYATQPLGAKAVQIQPPAGWFIQGTRHMKGCFYALSPPLEGLIGRSVFNIHDTEGRDTFEANVQWLRSILANPAELSDFEQVADDPNCKLGKLSAYHHKTAGSIRGRRVIYDSWMVLIRGRAVHFKLAAWEEDYPKLREAFYASMEKATINQLPQQYDVESSRAKLRLRIDEFNGISFPLAGVFEKPNEQQPSLIYQSAKPAFQDPGEFIIWGADGSAGSLEDAAMSYVSGFRKAAEGNICRDFERTGSYVAPAGAELVAYEATFGRQKNPAPSVYCSVICFQKGTQRFVIQLSSTLGSEKLKQDLVNEMLAGTQFLPPNRSLELPQWGARLLVPLDWRRQDDGQKENAMELMWNGTKVEQLPDGSRKAVVAGLSINRIQGVVVKDLREYFNNLGKTSDLKDLATIEDKIINRDGADEYCAEVTYTKGGLLHHSLVRLLKVDSSYFLLEGYSTEDIFLAQRDRLREILESFSRYEAPKLKD